MGMHSHHKNSQSTIDVDDIAIGVGNSGPNMNNFLDETLGGPSTRSNRGFQASPKVELQLPSINDKK